MSNGKKRDPFPRGDGSNKSSLEQSFRVLQGCWQGLQQNFCLLRTFWSAIEADFPTEPPKGYSCAGSKGYRQDPPGVLPVFQKRHLRCRARTIVFWAGPGRFPTTESCYSKQICALPSGKLCEGSFSL